MDNSWNIGLALEIIVPLATLLAWLWSRLDKRFDQIDKKFDQLDKRFDSVLSEIKELRHDLNNIQVQIGKLETRVEERTLKIVHVEKTGTEAAR